MDATKILKNLKKGRGTILTPHIDLYLERAKFPPVWDIQIANTKEEDGHYHPSSHSFMEPRHLYFDRLGARSGRRLLPPNEISASLQRTFACGHMWHGYVGNILMDMGMVNPENVEISYKKEITTEFGSVMGSGTVDLLDVDIPGQGEWLVDMKTVNKREFEAGINEFTMKKWEAQINLYGDWTERDKMMILAIEKDSPHRFMEFQILRNDALLDDIYTRWVYTEIHIGEEKAPPCDHPFEIDCGLKELCSYRAVANEDPIS